MTRAISVGGYVVALGCLTALVILGRLVPARLARFGVLLDAVMWSRPARIGLLLFWWWVGWHFLVSRPAGP
jgi:hypothetical protein